MNKLYKCALGLLTAFILSFTCFSNADTVEDLITNISSANTSVNASSTLQVYNNNGDYGTYCLKILSISNANGNTSIPLRFGYSSDGNYQSSNSFAVYTDWSTPIYMCIYTNRNYIYLYNGNSSKININYEFFKLNALFNTQIPVYTSLECQTQYNLIPISEVTANYCKLNFDLIDPQECPINSGTGTIVRSNLMINDIPYAQNQNINVFIPDFLAWNIAFNDFNTVIEVEGYNADEEYIENVINQEKLTPTNKDIEDMLTGFMTNYFPYLALAIVFLYLARKIFKLFK